MSVFDELKTGHDDLATWINDKNRKRDGRFLDVSDADTQKAFTQIAQLVGKGNYHPGEKKKFLSKADPWLIAKAKAIGGTVVTHETKVPPNSKKIKIPNICDSSSVPYINVYELLKSHKIRFNI